MLTYQGRPQASPDQDIKLQRHDSSTADRRFFAALVAIALAGLVLYAAISANWTKFSRAEVFFAECAREMIAANNWVTPLYHGKPFFDKPILTYWLIMASFKTFGLSHLAARLPSILAAVITVVLTGWAGRKLFGRQAGIFAAMTLASSFMFFSFAASCMSDMILVLFDLTTLTLLYAGAANNRRRTMFWLLAALSMGLAFITKGPVGIVLPGAFFLTYLGITRQLQKVTALHLVLGGALMALVTTPWFFAAYKANGAGALAYFFLHENLQRFAGSTYDTHKPLWFMAVSLLTGFAPWSLFLPFALFDSALRQRDGRKPGPSGERGSQLLYLWLWIAVVLVFFSASRGKIDYYALPAYPACALIVGLYLSRWLKSAASALILAGWVKSVILCLAAAAAALLLFRMSGGASPTQWMILPLTLMATGVLMALELKRRRPGAAYALLSLGIMLSATGFSLQLLPELTGLQPAQNFARMVNATTPGTRVGVHKLVESSIDEITFQTGREPEKLADSSELAVFLGAGQPAIAIAPHSAIEALPKATQDRWRILDKRPYLTHSLNPGYAIKRMGYLADDFPLSIVTND